MNEAYCPHYTHKPGRASKKCYVKISPEKRNFSGNFNKENRLFDVTFVDKARKMKKDIYGDSISRDDDGTFEEYHKKSYPSDNPIYEDPRDVIAEKPIKPPRKKETDGTLTSSRSIKDKTLKEVKRKLNKKYEALVLTLMERCEENVIVISEKDAQITKLKDKLKSVLEYNRLFAEENDHLRSQQSQLTLKIEELEGRNRELEGVNRDLVEKLAKADAAVKEQNDLSMPIPLVEVCVSCSSRQILLTQAREQNGRLHADMLAMKELLYRLNMQLAKYQEKLRQIQSTVADKSEHYVYKPSSDAFDSLITASFVFKQDGVGDGTNTQDAKKSTPSTPTKMVDASGLLSAQGLVPLFDAYQDNLLEKEALIHDYEKQFEIINRKSKSVVEENKHLNERLHSLEQECLESTKNYRRAVMDRETVELEKATLLERAEKAEAKLKEVYELYEDKMAAMMRDYETVHREYFATKNQLAASEGKMARLDATLRDRTVPADLHERRVDSCKRLLDELKHQYSMENERKTTLIAKLEEQNRLLERQKKVLEDKYENASKELDGIKEELKAALKNVKLYRRAASIFRERARAGRARRGSAHALAGSAAALARARQDAQRIRDQIKQVKAQAYKSLEELEHRIVERERRCVRIEEDCKRELDRIHLVLEHKEAVIQSLIDKVADVEEVRLSQTNTHRLQGIVSDSPHSSPAQNETENVKKEKARLVPGHGGYYQESRKVRDK